MAKFILSAVTLATTVFGIHAGDVSTCNPVNFTNKAADFTSLNSVIDIAISTGLLATNLAVLDPLALNSTILDPLTVSLLGLEFAVTPTIDSLDATGISSVVPRYLNVSGANTLDIGVDFNGTIDLDATFTLSVQQLDHKWYQICWTDILRPLRCNPTVITVDVALGVVKPSVVGNLAVDMVECPIGSTSKTCKQLTVSQILIAALSNQLEALLARILLRFKSASVNSLSLNFDSLTKLSFHFHDSNAFISEIIKLLLNFTKDSINKKDSVYRTVISVLNTLGTSLLNVLISTGLAPSFGSSCFDTGF